MSEPLTLGSAQILAQIGVSLTSAGNAIRCWGRSREEPLQRNPLLYVLRLLPIFCLIFLLVVIVQKVFLLRWILTTTDFSSRCILGLDFDTLFYGENVNFFPSNSKYAGLSI
jgi:hypothetical protein